MWVNLTVRLLVGLLFVASTLAALAEIDQSVTTTKISFSQAIDLTLERNPTLLAEGFQLRVASANVIQAGLRPRPVLGLMVENVAGTRPFTGIDGAETTISLSWVIERGKRERRIAFANASVSVVDTKQRIRRLDVAAETARRYLHCLRFENKLRQANEAIALAETALKAITRRVKRGRSPNADLARAEAELSRLRLEREKYEHDKQVALWKLAEQWGDSGTSFDSVTGSLNLLPALPNFESLLSQLQDTPDQEYFVNEQRVRESKLRLEEAKARPNWQLSAGVRRLETTNDQAFVANINIPLGFSNKNQGNVEAAKTRIEQTTVERNARLLKARTHLFAIHQELKHGLHEANALSVEIIPKLEFALRETKRAYSAGRYGFQELRLARSELIDAKGQYTDAAVLAFSSLIEIERLTGLSIESTLEPLGE